MTPDEFAARFPRLFHMAEADAWLSIRRHGLLSTTALLDLYGVQGPAREAIERRRRGDFIPVEHPVHGRALIRDQRPMTDESLAPVLRDGLTPADWYALLNARVFFWVEEERLQKLLGTYRHRRNVVLVLDTARVLADHAERITLSGINSGYSRRYAQPRGRETFRRLTDYPAWRVGVDGKRTRQPVAECAVDHALPEVERYLVEVRPADGVPNASSRPQEEDPRFWPG